MRWPDSSAATGTRSFTPWMPEATRPPGSGPRGAKPKPAMPSLANGLASVPPPMQYGTTMAAGSAARMHRPMASNHGSRPERHVREVDPRTLLLTGLTRDGVYLVEDGQVRGSVNNFSAAI
jgi:hypothetical protein